MVLQTLEFRDSVCLDTSGFCASNFTFYAIYNQSGMFAYEDGVIGFAPLPNEDKADVADGPSFVD